MTPKQILETIGVSAIASHLDALPNTVGHWKARGIPPKYWLSISRIEYGEGQRISLETIEAAHQAAEAAE